MNPFEKSPGTAAGGITLKDSSGKEWTGPAVPLPYIEAMIDSRVKRAIAKVQKTHLDGMKTIAKATAERFTAIEECLGRDLTETEADLRQAAQNFLEE